MNKCIAELIGTFAIVFFGTGAIIINQEFGGVITHPGIAITFGLIVMAMIYSFGDISGAHLNPAVTIAFAIGKRLPAVSILPYIISQLLGGLLASGILHFLFPGNVDLGATKPAGNAMQSFVLEGVMSFFLMLVILHVSRGSKEEGMFAGLAIGSVVLLEAMVGGPVSGASMNPARSFAPALVSGNLGDIWIYILAPLGGAMLAVPVSYFLQSKSKDYADRVV